MDIPPKTDELAEQRSFWTCIFGLPFGLCLASLAYLIYSTLNQGRVLLILLVMAVGTTFWTWMVRQAEKKDIAEGNDWIARNIHYSNQVIIGAIGMWLLLSVLVFLTLFGGVKP